MSFSVTTQHIIDVVSSVRSDLQTRVLLNNDLTEEMIRNTINQAIASTAENAGITTSTVAAACQRNLELTAEGFEELICDHFAGGDELINTVIAHAKLATGNDNSADIRAALNDLRFKI